MSGGPSTQFLSEVSKRIFRQGLGEDTSSLFICADVVDADVTGVDVVTEMVVLDHKVARIRFISFICCKLVGACLPLLHPCCIQEIERFVGLGTVERYELPSCRWCDRVGCQGSCEYLHLHQ
jgi:hypothetical protein